MRVCVSHEGLVRTLRREWHVADKLRTSMSDRGDKMLRKSSVGRQLSNDVERDEAGYAQAIVAVNLKWEAGLGHLSVQIKSK